MARLDLNLLPIAVALYDRRSVSQAAQALGMSQPAVSAALARMRAYFGDPLFVRTARGMEPTPRAISLVTPARGVMARIEEEVLTDVAFDPATTTRTFTFVLSDVGEMVFLPRILESLRTQAPNAAVRSVTPPVAEVERGLESGDIDLAIGYFPDLRKKNYFQQRLFTDTFACLLRADHPIRGNRLSLRQFLSLGHAVVHAEGRTQEVFERFLARRRIQRKIVLTTPHYMSIPVIVAQSDLVVTVPQPLAKYFSGLTANLKIVTPSLEIPRIDLKSHWHRKYQNDAAHRWLRGLVASLFHG